MAGKAKRDGKMERVAEGVYRRNGSYLVPIWDPARNSGKGGKEWHGPKCGLACRHDEIVDIQSAKRAKRQLEETKRQRRGRGTEVVRDWADRWLTVFPRMKESTNVHNTERVRAFVNQ